MSKRVKQVNELIRSLVGRIFLQELELPRDVFVTIVKVDTAPDLKNCDIFISVIPDNKSLSTFKKIDNSKRHVQKILAQNLTMKFSPRIHIKLDYTERNAAKIDAVLDNL